MFEGWMDIIMDTDHSQRDAMGISWDGIKIGTDLVDTYTTLAYRKEPEDLVGKIFYWAGTVSQLVIGLITQPFGIAAFLLEESAQSVGMGAYFLYGAKDWEHLSEFMPMWETTLDTYETVAKSFAVLNPIGAGAVIIYLQAAKKSRAMMGQAMHTQLCKDARALGIEKPQQQDAQDLILLIGIAESDKAAEEIKKQNALGTLALKSIPTNADIYIDGKSLGLQTPETFKNLTEGPHDVAVSRYNTKTKTTDVYAATITIRAGKKLEVTLHIPSGVSDDEDKITMTTGILMIQSTPTGAMIYLNNADTRKITSETFKEQKPGTYTVKLRYFTRAIAAWDEYEFTVDLAVNEKAELRVNIPGKAFDKIVEKINKEETETPQLGDFIKTTVNCVKMIDGDTFETDTGEKIRILGMDAPEAGQPIAEISTEFMASRILDKKVIIKIQTQLPIDVYGRTLAIANRTDGENVAVSSIANGLAKAHIFNDATYDPARYLEAEKIAKQRQLGIWNPATPGIIWRS